MHKHHVALHARYYQERHRTEVSPFAHGPPPLDQKRERIRGHGPGCHDAEGVLCSVRQLTSLQQQPACSGLHTSFTCCHLLEPVQGGNGLTDHLNLLASQTVVIDARTHMLGRLASVVAKQLLNGQHIVSACFRSLKHGIAE
jgi:hypothetical protein